MRGVVDLHRSADLSRQTLGRLLLVRATRHSPSQESWEAHPSRLSMTGRLQKEGTPFTASSIEASRSVLGVGHSVFGAGTTLVTRPNENLEAFRSYAARFLSRVPHRVFHIACFTSRVSHRVLILVNRISDSVGLIVRKERPSPAFGTVISTHNPHNCYDRARGCTLSTPSILFSLNFGNIELE